MEKVLGNLINTFRVSGSEDKVRKIIREALGETKCEIFEDIMGNLIVKKGEGSEKLMISANMDEVGLMVTYIEESGFLRVTNVGEIEADACKNSFVEFENGIKGRVLVSKEKPGIEDLYIDIMVENKEEAEKEVKEGDICRFNFGILEKGEKIQAHGLSNALGCYALIEAIKKCEKPNKEYYFVFSTQGEVGGRGGRAAAYNINPDMCVVITTHEAGDYIGGEGNVELEHGPILRVRDKSLLLSQKVKELVEEAAEKNDISLQYTIGTETSEGGVIHKERSGIETGVLAIPVRYNKTLIESASMKDVDDLVKLLNTFMA